MTSKKRALKRRLLILKKFSPVFMLVLTCAVLILLINVERKPYRGRLNEGDVCLTAVYAPFNFSYPGKVDEEKTEAKRQEYISKTGWVYNTDQNQNQKILSQSELFFRNLKEIRALDISVGEKVSKLSEETGLPLSDSAIKTFLTQGEAADIDSWSAKEKDILEAILKNGIISDADKGKIQNAGPPVLYIKDTQTQQEQIKNLNNVYLPEDLKEPLVILASEYFPDSRKLRVSIVELSTEILRPNLVFDESGTKKRKEEAAKSAPLQYEMIDIKKGELIVNKGERVAKEHIEKLNAVDEIQGGSGGIGFLVGQSVVVFLFLLAIWIYLFFFERGLLRISNLLLITSLMVLVAACARIITLTPLPTFLIPLASATILTAMLLSARLSLILAFTLGVIISIVSGDKFSAFLVLAIGGAVGAFAARNIRRRAQILKAGLYVGLTNFACICSVGLMNYLQPEVYLRDGLWGIANGVLSSALVMVLLPVYEFLFGLTTDISLLEITDMNHPLLKEMIIKAPGTYHHSLVVGNLAEAACDAIGANSLLARVASYYHDIGKIENAEYFSENQAKQESRHEKLTPTMSSLLIINHVKKGMELAKKYKLNKAIVDMIPQHHGTSVTHYFYQRALEETEDPEQVKEERFRYPGPKPQSKEAAVILLADSVEAASRNLTNPTASRISALVRRVINNKFIDGQLDQCDLSLKDLNKIADAFVRVLTGVFHTRSSELPNNGKKNKNENRDTEHPEEKAD